MFLGIFSFKKPKCKTKKRQFQIEAFQFPTLPPMRAPPPPTNDPEGSLEQFKSSDFQSLVYSTHPLPLAGFLCLRQM